MTGTMMNDSYSIQRIQTAKYDLSQFMTVPASKTAQNNKSKRVDVEEQPSTATMAYSTVPGNVQSNPYDGRLDGRLQSQNN